MRQFKVLIVVTVMAAAAVFGRALVALDAGDILKAVAVGAAIREAAEPLNKFINTVTANRGKTAGAATKVVPSISVGEKSYIGAAQVTGSTAQVAGAKAIFQYDAVFDGGKYRLKLMFPTNSINPLKFKRVSGVGISALINNAITGPAGAYQSAGVDTGDVVRAAVIGAAITQVADPLNKFINTVYGQKGVGSDYATKVVPRISVGERAYIGGVQVVGPAAAVKRVKAVFQYEEQFKSGRFNIGIVVPGDTLNPLKFSRVKGVGVSAVIDTTVATDTHEAGKGGGGGGSAGRVSERSGSAADADAWIDRAHEYIQQAKKDIDGKKKDRDDDEGYGKGKGKGKGHSHGSVNSSEANKTLADARSTLARARHERAQGNYNGAVSLAKEAMRIADVARSKV